MVGQLQHGIRPTRHVDPARQLIDHILQQQSPGLSLSARLLLSQQLARLGDLVPDNHGSARYLYAIENAVRHERHQLIIGCHLLKWGGAYHVFAIIAMRIHEREWSMHALDAPSIRLLYATAYAGENILDRRIPCLRAIARTEQRMNGGSGMVFVEQSTLVVIDHNPISDTLEDCVKLLGLRLRIVIEARIFERDGCLRGKRLEQCLIICAEAPRLVMTQQQTTTYVAIAIQQWSAQKAACHRVAAGRPDRTQIVGASATARKLVRLPSGKVAR